MHSPNCCATFSYLIARGIKRSALHGQHSDACACAHDVSDVIYTRKDKIDAIVSCHLPTHASHDAFKLFKICRRVVAAR
jgi:hypothetical protein